MKARFPSESDISAALAQEEDPVDDMTRAQLVRSLQPHFQEPMEVDEYLEDDQDTESQDPSGWCDEDFNVEETEVPIDMENEVEDDQESDLASQEIITFQQAMDILHKLKSYSVV